MRFQWLAGSVVLFIIFRLVFMLYRRKIRYRKAVFYAGFWTTVLLAIVFPEETNKIARFFNITRGADFFIYLSIISIFYLLFKIFERMERMEKNITEAVRHIALLKKEMEDESTSRKKQF